jgi:Domain of unknown function (DUF4911)
MQAIYLEIAAEHIAYIKFIFESYEEVGIIRTVEKKRAVIALLAMDDFIDAARAILEALKKEIPLREIPRPAEIENDWFMVELAAELSNR